MELDVLTGSRTWEDTARLARSLEGAGVSGMLFTETAEAPWMKIAAASMATSKLHFSTGIAVAFPRSPMIAAVIGWELAQNTRGRFRLGLGSQVKGHVVRRYSADFSSPALRLRDYVAAVKACFRAFRREEELLHEGPFYRLSLLPEAWSPARHEYGDVRVDISAVGPAMLHVAGEIADGIHVHPLHSMHYVNSRLLPAVAEGARAAGRMPSEVRLIVPVFAAPGDTPEEREPLVRRARRQIAFYGSTPNYAFQFDEVGFEGTMPRLRELLESSDHDGMMATITDDMLEHFAVVCTWDELADRLIGRYGGAAARLVMYLAENSIRRNPQNLGKWGEVARAVRAAA